MMLSKQTTRILSIAIALVTILGMLALLILPLFV
jgi:uncharacterized membrane protein YadS